MKNKQLANFDVPIKKAPNWGFLEAESRLFVSVMSGHSVGNSD
jgi:hypothetical protein